jgi:hypothetical protein
MKAVIRTLRWGKGKKVDVLREICSPQPLNDAPQGVERGRWV